MVQPLKSKTTCLETELNYFGDGFFKASSKTRLQSKAQTKYKSE